MGGIQNVPGEGDEIDLVSQKRDDFARIEENKVAVPYEWQRDKALGEMELLFPDPAE